MYEIKYLHEKMHENIHKKLQEKLHEKLHEIFFKKLSKKMHEKLHEKLHGNLNEKLHDMLHAKLHKKMRGKLHEEMWKFHETLWSFMNLCISKHITTISDWKIHTLGILNKDWEKINVFQRNKVNFNKSWKVQSRYNSKMHILNFVKIRQLQGIQATWERKTALSRLRPKWGSEEYFTPKCTIKNCETYSVNFIKIEHR